MIYVLELLLFLFIFVVYWANRGSLISITFVSTASFLISVSVYCMFYSTIGADISAFCVILVMGSLFAMLAGESIGKKLTIRKKPKMIQGIQNKYYYISVRTMVMSFLGMLVVFVIRFYDLYKFSLTIGNSAGLLGTISSTRLSYAMGEYSSESLLMNIAIWITLVCEIYAYTYLYYFIYNVTFEGICLKRMLLPILGYIIISISFTGRTQYIIIVSMIIWMLIFLNFKKVGNEKKVNAILIKKIMKIGIFAIVVIFIYGALTRTSDENSSVVSTIVAYIGAPLYGFDQLKDVGMYGIQTSEKSFGYYTLQNLHTFLNQFGAEFDTVSFHNLRFFDYAKGSSNIYTGLFFPYQDYGAMGLILSRFLLGGVIGIIEKRTTRGNVEDWKTIIWVIIMGLLYYDGICSYIADRYYDNLLDPITVIKYTVFSALVVKLLCHNSIKTIPREKFKKT